MTILLARIHQCISWWWKLCGIYISYKQKQMVRSLVVCLSIFICCIGIA